VNLADALVAVTGIVLVAGELWYFLGPRKSPVAATALGGGAQEIKVVVKAGYHPDVIPVEVGRPVRLLFYRDETADCSARIVFEELGIERDLPPFETTPIEFTPDKSGDIHFRCGMSVMRGRVVAEVGRDGARANLGKGHSKHG